MNKRNRLSFAGILLFLFVLFLTSETVYTLNNDSTELRRIILHKSVESSQNSNADKPLNYLLWAAKIRSFYQLKKYNKIFAGNEFDIYTNQIKNSKSDKTEYKNYIKTLDIDKIFASKDEDFLRIFYNLALIADKSGNKDDVLPFLKIALIMEPELSHIHIEIANYYLLKNDAADANKTLDNCMKLKDPYIHCKSFKTGILNYTPLNVGNLKEGIDKQYE